MRDYNNFTNLEDKRRHKFIIYSLYILSFLGFVYGEVWLFFKLYLPSIICYFVFVLSILGLYYKKLGIRINYMANGMILLSIAYCFVMNIMIYKYFPIMIAYYPIIPLAALLILSRRVSMVWIFVTSIALVISTILSECYSIDVKLTGVAIKNINFFQGFSIFFIILSLLYLYNIYIAEYINILNSKTAIIEKSKQKIENTQKYKDKFFSIVSHEIRTPMNAIKGISELLIKTKEENDKNEELYNILNNSSKHLLSLINDILDIGKLDENKLILHEVNFDIRKTLGSIVEMIKYTANEKNIDVNFHFEPNFPQFIKGDSIRFNQIIVNLLNNAVKFTDKGSVSLLANTKVEDEKEYLLISIEDTGIGIPEDKRDSIFDRFCFNNFEVHQKYGGSGLGLSISKSLVEKMNGKIWFESVENMGTTFFIQIPLIQAEEKVEEINQNDLDFFTQTDGIDSEILIVDDNALNLFIAKKLIQNSLPSLVIHSAENGQQALDFIHSHPHKISLILMDLQMPVLNGVETTIRLKNNEKTKNIPIVAMTASGDSDEIKNSLDNGMISYLSKPFESINLISIILKYIDKETH